MSLGVLYIHWTLSQPVMCDLSCLGYLDQDSFDTGNADIVQQGEKKRRNCMDVSVIVQCYCHRNGNRNRSDNAQKPSPSKIKIDSHTNPTSSSFKRLNFNRRRHLKVTGGKEKLDSGVLGKCTIVFPLPVRLKGMYRTEAVGFCGRKVSGLEGDVFTTRT